MSNAGQVGTVPVLVQSAHVLATAKMRRATVLRFFEYCSLRQCNGLDNKQRCPNDKILAIFATILAITDLRQQRHQICIRP